MDSIDIYVFDNGLIRPESADRATAPGTATISNIRTPPGECYDTDIPLADWLTRQEAAQVVGKSVKTIDRYIRKGFVERRDPHGAVRISRVSIERLIQRKLTARPDRPMITLEAERYDAMLLRLHIFECRDRLLQASEQLGVEHQQREAELLAELGAAREKLDAKHRDLITAAEMIKTERQRSTALEGERRQVAVEMQRLAAERKKLIEAQDQKIARPIWQLLLAWLQGR